MLIFDNVSYCYHSKASGLKNITLTINKGDFVFITGPSSQYKTTLLNLIYGKILPMEGTIQIFDMSLPHDKKKIPLLRKRIGYIFSPPLFFDKLTVEENLKIALLIKSEIKSKDLLEEKINHVLSFFPNIKKDTEVYKLSASDRERLNILRGIVSKPSLLLADDPFKHFASEEIREIMDIFSEENNSGTTIIIATSNKEIPEHYKKRTVEIKGGRILNES